jgi:hypothetical protein
MENKQANKPAAGNADWGRSFNSGTLGSACLSRDVRPIKDHMSKRRFSTLSVVVMITVTALLTWLNLRMSWGWAGGCGFPFQWYTYKDFATPSSPAQQYHYLSFLADIAIALAIVAVVGMLIERMSTRHRHEY